MKRGAAFAWVVLTVLAHTHEPGPPIEGAPTRGPHEPGSARPGHGMEPGNAQLLQAPGAQPATIHPTRTMAITQLASMDAVNAIERQSEPYLFHERASREASPDAAGSLGRPYEPAGIAAEPATGD